MGDKTRKGQRFLVWLTVVVLAAMGAVAVSNSIKERSLAAKIAKARAAGFPFDGKDLEPDPLPLPQHNAALIYDSLEAMQRSIVYSDRAAADEVIALRMRAPLSPKDAAVMRAYVREANAVIEAFVAASQMPECYFAHDWDKGAELLLPEYAAVKSAAKLTAVRARVRAMDGDPRALDDLAAVRRAAGHMKAQPPFIAMLVSLSLGGIYAAAAEAVLPCFAEDPEALARLREDAAKLPETWDLTQHLRTEAFLAWWCGKDLRANLGDYYYSGHGGTDLRFEAAVRSGSVRCNYQMAVLDLFTPTLASYDARSDGRATMADLEARSRAASSRGLHGMLLEIVVPLFWKMPEAINRSLARRRCLLALTEVVAHRQRTGALPETLRDAGIVTADPFGGRELGYRREGEGCRIWSIGVNLTDEAGKLREESHHSDDHVVRFQPFRR